MRSLVLRALVAVLAATALVTVHEASSVEAATASVTCDPQPAGGPVGTAPLLSYTAINPVRIVDTRNNVGGVGAKIDRGCTMRVNIGADVPAGAQAVALSMTAVDAEADYFTVYPCAAGRPETSNLNARAGFATPNLVVAIPDASRQICIYSHGRSHLIIDVSGWWSYGPDRFASVAPTRVYDSRQPGLAPLARFQERVVAIPSSVIASDARAAVVNLTAANGVQPGYMTAYPCGQAPPVASNVNFKAEEARAVGAIVGLGAGRTLCVIADTTVHVIVDVTGYYAPAPAFGPAAVLEPTAGRRVVDSRNGIGGPSQPLAPGEVRSFDPVAGLADADDASAVMLNFVSTDAAAAGFLTAYPCGGAVPDVSNLNFVRGEAATNLSTVKLGADRKICIVSSVQTNVIVDVFGVMTAPPGSPFERLSVDKPTWPPFDPAATDYVIECGAGAGTATVAMDFDFLPFTSAQLSVAGGPATPIGTGTASFPLRTDQPVVVSTSHQGDGRDYHFRCVPTDFPRLEVLRPGNPAPGWYLTTFGFVSPSGPYVAILDNYGAPVWYKRVSQPVIDLKRLSDGRLAFTPTFGPFGIDANQGYWLTNLQGGPTVKHQTVGGLLTDHHDYNELPGVPNGRALVSYPIVDNVDLTGMPGGTANDTIADGVIQEVNAVGTELWRWDMSDHFDPATSTFPLNFDGSQPPPAGVPGFPDAWDVFHINSFDREPDGDYVVAARHMDGVFRVHRTSGNVTWTLGMPASTDPGAKQLRIVGDPYNGPKRPHDARLNGNVLTMFDNQAGVPGRQSRAVAYSIDTTTNPADPTATMLWEFRNAAPFTGDTLGSVQQAADGSVLINWGAGLQPIIEELAANGTRLMAVGLPNGGNSYRTVKYAPTDFDVNDLRATAGGSVAPPS